MDAIRGSNLTQSTVNQPTNLSANKVDIEPAVDLDIVSKAIESSKIVPPDVVKTSEPTREAVAKAADQLQNFVQSMGRNLNFSIDQTTGYHVVRVINPETNEVVRQLPSQELLRLAQTMDSLQNVLVNQKA